MLRKSIKINDKGFSLFSLWNKIKQTPFPILINKIKAKIKRELVYRKQKAIDLKKGSYPEISSHSKLLNGIYDQELTGLNRTSDISSLLSHDLKILSDKSVNVNLETECDQQGLLIQRVNASNKEISLEYFSKISSDYKLINWQKDHNSNYEWNPLSPSKEIVYGNVEGADIKVPWELGRLHQLPVLALNWSKDNNKAFIEIKNLLCDFLASNPPRFGTQWMTSMDVSIRLINILISYDILKQKGLVDYYYESIVHYATNIHLEHIMSNLEWSGGQRGNHYFMNICAMIISGVYLESTTGNEALKKGIAALLTEIHYQFNKDGGNFEASLPYHYFTLEMLLITLYILRGANDNKKDFINKGFNGEIILGNKRVWFSKQHLDQISRIIKFSKALIIDDHIPQIGDNDSGKVIDLSTFKINVLTLLYKVDIVTGSIAFSENQNNDIAEWKLFNESGFYINRSSGADLILRCGKIGQNGKGGHDHNDHLSFEFYYKGLPFIVDPGTYNYTAYPELRNQFRSVDHHNTLIIEEEEQNTFDRGSKDDLFWLKQHRTHSKVLKADGGHFIGIHNAYSSVHKRSIIFSNNLIEIHDECDINTMKYIHLHLHPEVKLEKKEDSVILSRDNSSITINLNTEYIDEKYNYSPEYGVLQETSRIIVNISESKYSWGIQLK